jgi:septal ring factor EnvC (AmiA/AmiB activator)
MRRSFALLGFVAIAFAAGDVRPQSDTSGELVDLRLAEVDKRQRAARKALEALAQQGDQTRIRLLARGRAYVRKSRAGLLPVGGGFEALVSHATRLERLRRALGRDLEAEQAVVRRKIQLGKELDDLATRRAPLEVQQRAMREARTALLAAQDRSLAFQRAFQGQGDHTAVYGADVGPIDPVPVSSGFAAMKGRLPFPLSGRSEIRSARRASSDGPGLELRAPLGSPVLAVYAARVAFADEYADYGKTVILDHGERHYTVSANLRDIQIAVGDEIKAGTRIGSVGDGGAGPQLYFEVRVGSETADPAEWFGL